AHEDHDDLATQNVIRGQVITSLYGQLSCIQGLIVGIHSTDAPTVRAPYLPDCRYTEPHQIALGSRGVTLEISMEGVIAPRQIELVIRLGKMVKPYIDIAGLQKTARGQQENLQSRLGR